MNKSIVLIDGIARNRKGGAVIETDSVTYWIEGKDHWEESYLNRKIKVSGIVENRNDNPVFLDTSEIKTQGIPVSSEEELINQQERFWIFEMKIME